MVEDIISELYTLSDEKVVKKLIKEKCDLPVIGVKIGDMKKLIKKYGIKNNNELAKKLIKTNVYDIVYVGYLIMDLKTIEKEYLISLIKQSDYYKMRINNLAYSMSEHPDYEYFIQYLKDNFDDTHQSMYYAVIAGRVIIDPDFKNEEIFHICEEIGLKINSVLYEPLPETRHEMNQLIGYAAMQIPKYDQQLMQIYNSYITSYHHDILNRKNADQIAFIQMCIERKIQAKRRKSCRC